MMNQDKEQSKDELAAAILKEVYESAKDKPADTTRSAKDELSKAATAEELKGSDADVDPNVGFDKQISAEERAEQVKGSDAGASQES